MKKLIITVGLPRSGKSTWVKKQPYTIVSKDALRLAIHGKPYLQVAEPMVSVIEQYMISSLFIAGNDTIIIDECNTSRKRRDAWIGNWEREFKIFKTPVDVCLERAKQTAINEEHLKGLSDAIVRMHENWEDVSDEEGKFEVILLN